MSFLYWLEGLRNGFLDALFSILTKLGEETFFLVLALLFFWCVNKREGLYILVVGLFGTVLNQTLKLICRIPRPWVRDPGFTIVEAAREEATGYSFPSGHTQNAAGTFGSIAVWNRKHKPTVIVFVALILLVGLSRMYLGVHTPLDVVVSLAIAGVLIFALRPVFEKEESFHRVMPYIVLCGVLLSVGLLLFVNLLPTDGMDPHNLASGKENAATLFGCTLGLVPMYFVDRYVTKFDTKASWYVQIIKLVLGLLGVIAIKAGLSTPLVLLFRNTYVARAVRYFLIVGFAGIVWPYCFRFLVKIRIPLLDKLGEKVRSKR